MNQDRRSPWKACVGILLLAGLIMGFVFYPDYDTRPLRQQLLCATVGAEVEIVDEEVLGTDVICQLRIGDQIGFAQFRDFLGKLRLEQYDVSNSDRMVQFLEVDGRSWILLICDQPQVHQAVIHYQDIAAGTFIPGDPIDMAGRQMVLVPHDPTLGAHGFTEYFDADGNPI